MPTKIVKQRRLELTIRLAVRTYHVYSQILSPSLKTEVYQIRENFQALCLDAEKCSRVICLLFQEIWDITKDKIIQFIPFRIKRKNEWEASFLETLVHFVIILVTMWLLLQLSSFGIVLLPVLATVIPSITSIEFKKK